MQQAKSLIFSILLISIDQISKSYIAAHLKLQESLDIAPMLSFKYAQNYGIAFSFCEKNSALFLSLCSSIITIFMFFCFINEKSRYNRLAYLLIISGAISNLVDRIYFGYVRDFIYCHTESWSFAIFNLADSFISIGVAILILHGIFYWQNSKT